MLRIGSLANSFPGNSSSRSLQLCRCGCSHKLTYKNARIVKTLCPTTWSPSHLSDLHRRPGRSTVCVHRLRPLLLQHLYQRVAKQERQLYPMSSLQSGSDYSWETAAQQKSRGNSECTRSSLWRRRLRRSYDAWSVQATQKRLCHGECNLWECWVPIFVASSWESKSQMCFVVEGKSRSCWSQMRWERCGDTTIEKEAYWTEEDNQNLEEQSSRRREGKQKTKRESANVPPRTSADKVANCVLENKLKIIREWESF